MKLLLFVIFIFFKFTTLVNASNVVYIDMSYILSNSIHGKLILNQLDAKNKKNIIELESKENLLKELEKKINNQRNILSKTELEKKIKDLKSKILVFNKDKENLSKEFNEYKNNQVADFMKKIQPLVSNYIKKNSINIVLDKKNVIIGEKDHDITFEILEIVNKNIK
tara:strand:- start:188 stop:688 length:501 start_codon:yes stop_codon:yes gene_type:complete